MPEKIWLDDTPYTWLHRNLKRLGTTMLISAVCDLCVSVCTFVLPSWVAGLMGMAVPGERFLFYLWPLVHLTFACFCVLAWMDIKRNILIVTGAIVGRGIYAAFMFLSVWLLAARPAWAVACGISAAFAIAHYVLLRLSDFGFWQVFTQAGNPPGLRRRSRA